MQFPHSSANHWHYISTAANAGLVCRLYTMVCISKRPPTEGLSFARVHV